MAPSATAMAGSENFIVPASGCMRPWRDVERERESYAETRMDDAKNECVPALGRK